MKKFSCLERILIPTYNNPNEIKFGEVAFDHEKCNGCSLCVQICPANSLLMEDKKVKMKSPKESGCISCGCCMVICPNEAVVMKLPYVFTGYFKTIDHGDPKPPRL